MGKFELSKKTIAVIVLVLGVIAFGFFSCSGGDDEEKKSNSQSSILVPSTTKKLQTFKAPTSSKPTTIPKYVKAPFSEAVKRELYALSKTGEVISGNPGAYVSPRYEAILGGDTSSGVPISELDNPDHSDLELAVFNVARTTAIDITKAQITGEGASRFPTYFGAGNEPGTCKSFQLKHAGATSLPIANDNRWIASPVLWKATCGEKSTYTVEQQTTVYFTLVNNVLTPKQFSEVPGS